jgi:mono/diheme cytochrome c family protein
MNATRGLLLGAVLTVLTGIAVSAVVVDPSLKLGHAQGAYILGCGGCHGEDGRTNSRLVPDLRDLAGYYLRTQAGREYLVRLPNVSFYTANNEDLAQILNYVTFTLGKEGVPANARPYNAEEVARLRHAPLTEVSLVAYRGQIVDDLIAHHDAPVALRTYGTTAYALPSP